MMSVSTIGNMAGLKLCGKNGHATRKKSKKINGTIFDAGVDLRSLINGHRKMGEAQSILRFHFVHQWSLPNHKKRIIIEIRTGAQKHNASSHGRFLCRCNAIIVIESTTRKSSQKARVGEKLLLGGSFSSSSSCFDFSVSFFPVESNAVSSWHISSIGMYMFCRCVMLWSHTLPRIMSMPKRHQSKAVSVYV